MKKYISMLSAVVALVFLTATPGCPAPPPKPNVVVIMVDDMPPAAIFHMPAVSSLRQEGVTFTNAITPLNSCEPSRASFFTGKQYPVPTGTSNWDVVTDYDDQNTIWTWLKAKGYTTGLFGKFFQNYTVVAPYVPPGIDEFVVMRLADYFDIPVVRNGVQEQLPPGVYSTDFFGNEAVQFIQDHAQDTDPFFVMFTPYGPHITLPDFLPIPAPRHEGLYQNYPPYRPIAWNEEDMSDKPKLVNMPYADTDQLFADTLETVQSVNEVIAQIMATLEAEGVADNTIVVFVSDNGYATGQHRWTSKFLPYNASISTPMVVSYPFKTSGCYPSGCVDTGLIAMGTDLNATIVDLLNLSPTTTQDGLSFKKRVSSSVKGNPPVREHIQIGPEFYPWGYVGVRTDEWAYYVWQTGEEELYDLQADPAQMEGAIANDPDYDAIKAELGALLPSF